MFCCGVGFAEASVKILIRLWKKGNQWLQSFVNKNYINDAI